MKGQTDLEADTMVSTQSETNKEKRSQNERGLKKLTGKLDSIGKLDIEYRRDRSAKYLFYANERVNIEEIALQSIFFTQMRAIRFIFYLSCIRKT